jgi:hypothetical protein
MSDRLLVVSITIFYLVYYSYSGEVLVLLKIAGQEHPDRHRPTAGIKQWMAPAVDT